VDHGALQSVEAGLELAIPIRLKHRNGTILIDSGETPTPSDRVDRTLVRAICLARSWAASLADGEIESTKQLARRHGVCNRHAGQIMPLAWLAPDLVEAILAGKQPAAVSLGALTKQPLPIEWEAQRKLFANLG
jgi:site-specific DNA recombinase